MTTQLAPPIFFQAFATNGSFLVGGLLNTYAAGTSTPQVSYVDSTQTTQNTNPIVLDAWGSCELWLDPTLSYKFILTDAAGNLLKTVDQVNSNLTAAGLATLLTGYVTNATLASELTGYAPAGSYVTSSSLITTLGGYETVAAATAANTAQTAALATQATAQTAATTAQGVAFNAAIALLAPLASPALTGVPTASTAAAGTSTTQLATTAFVTLAETAVLQINGSQKFASGLVLQWGQAAAEATVTFPIPFTTLYTVITQCKLAAGANPTQVYLTAQSATSFTTGSSDSLPDGFNWIALGH
jgi:hypothetical protein